jgi:hypothetical protein
VKADLNQIDRPQALARRATLLATQY